MPLTDPRQPPPCTTIQLALLSVLLYDAVKPNTLKSCLTLTHTHSTYSSPHHGAGWQADRWCADNAVSLEQRTKALRAGREIHLVEMGAGRCGGPDRMGIVEEERAVGGCAGKGEAVFDSTGLFLKVT